jgi:hypothetical protein
VRCNVEIIRERQLRAESGRSLRIAPRSAKRTKRTQDETAEIFASRLPVPSTTSSLKEMFFLHFKAQRESP